MKAAVRSKYGPPSVLSIQELETPIPKDNEVLIRVHATTVNRSDCHILSGKPFVMRLFTGLFKPRSAITGTDFTGEIEATGKNVTSFNPGDKVMGFGGGLGTGGHAQYKVCSTAKGIMVLMPANLSYEQAAACLEGTFYASCINKLQPKPGQKALVRGATGAIGSAMVQILKFYGVYITAVCGGENRELLRSLGADKVIDYRTEDFTKDNEQYDFIFDNAGKSNFGRCKPLLKKHGIYFPADGPINLLWTLVTRITGGKKVSFLTPKSFKENLNFIKDLVEGGNFRPLIDRTYPLDKIAEAYTYVARGQKIGNVIITMDTI